MATYEREEIENLLLALEDQGALFPDFSLAREENALKLLGTGGFSVVYEMTSRSNCQTHYALKVMGLQPHIVASGDFRAAARMQRLLMEQTDYVVRILAVKKLWVRLTENGEICGLWENDPPENEDSCLQLQFVLMDKLESILSRNRFGRISLQRQELETEAEVLKLGIQIGQALLCAHKNQILHRDIKLENIFWDARENCYKLGDFGAAKLTKDGSAETLVYTDGYGAPEIQRVLTENYDAAADIYSLGITLYLLLNQLKFPGSDGYHSREIQYHPDFVFPAPENASEGLTRVLRKMCAYQKADRYGSMAEVLAALAEAAEEHTEQWENPQWMDLTTETYREETPTSEAPTELPRESRAGRILQKRATARSARRENVFFLITFTAVFYFITAVYGTAALSVSQWQFWLFPAMMLLEAVFLSAGKLRIPACLLAVGMMLWSCISTGLSPVHILAFVYMLAGMQIPLYSMAAAVCLWVFLPPEQLGIGIQNHWGWILLTLVMAMSHRAAVTPANKKTAAPICYRRGYYLISWLPFLLAGVGMFFAVRRWIWQRPFPELLQAVYPIRTALCAFALYVVQHMFWDKGEETEEEEAV